MMRSGAYRDNLVKISPSMLVSPESPPTLLAYGELDKVAPFAASRDLARTLEANGVPHDALVFPNSGHALNRDPALAAKLGRKINEYLDRYVPLG
jgi:dipeptidyl aminopeptidase/acylaminoacyl peptidase